MITISIVQDNHESIINRIFDFKEQIITLGRFNHSGSKKVDIVLPDNVLLSRNHSNIKIHSSGKISYTDESKLGTVIDGRTINRQTVILRNSEHEISFSISEPFKIVIKNEAIRENAVEELVKRSSNPSKIENVSGKTVRVNVEKAFASKSTIIFGRGTNADVTLDSLNISRQHSSISRNNGSFELKDLGSKNGTYVNGKKISSSPITMGDFIQLGPYQIKLVSNEYEVESPEITKYSIVCKDVYRTVQVKSKPLTILQTCSLKIKKDSLVAIMGPSGCGKSTLLNAMNGLNPATGGDIYINGQNLYKNYDSLKKSFGYVPQDDIVHSNLTVNETLWYAAKLRLEQDITDEEIKRKIDKILTELKIDHEKNKKVSELSGGGRKRVCIASELLTEPSILFLDEPTSPLDPAMINEFLTILKNLSEQGTTIIMVTHKPEDLQYMDEVIFLASEGYLTYHGNPGAAMYNYFSKSDIIGIYELLNDQQKIKQYYKGATESRAGMTSIIEQNRAVPTLSKENNSLSQVFWLSRRYLSLKLSDKRATLISVLQAPFIAIIMLLIFDHIQVRMLYFLAISAIWCGVNNSAREISNEVNIYRRERMFNLRIFSYLSSKVIIQSILILIQTVFFLIVLQLFYGLADSVIQFLSYGLFLFCLTLSASFMGLFISALFRKQEKVTSMMPVVLLPQILLAGVISPLGLNGPWHVDTLSQLTLGRWGTQGLCNIRQEVEENINYVTFDAFDLNQDDPIMHSEKEIVHFTDILRYPDLFGIGKERTDKYSKETFHQYSLLNDYFALLILNCLFITGIIFGLQRMDPL